MLLGRIGKQASGDQEMSQMTRDLFDSVERENDLTEQLKFTEEETKMMRKKVHELEEENERLNVQLKKLSKDTAKHSAKGSFAKKESSDKPKIIITDPDDSDSSVTDTDTELEAEINIVEARLQLGLLEQELSLSHRKITDVEQQNENCQTQIKVLQEQLNHREQLLSVYPDPPSPNSYYQDKIKELTIECDDLRWKVIEKDRTIERLSTQASAKARQGRLKKARSLDSDPHVVQINDLRRQLDIVSHEAELFKDRLSTASAEGEKLAEENTRLRLLQRVPSIQADDAAIENIELRDNSKKLEDDNKRLLEQVRILTDSVQTLTKTPRSPTKDPPLPIGLAENTNGSRDLQKQLDRVLEENKSLRNKMADLEKLSTSRDENGGKFNNEQAIQKKAETVSSNNGAESRDLLMENILDLEDELDGFRSKLKAKEYENIRLQDEIRSLGKELEDVREDTKYAETELMQEVDMLHDRNAVLSNLLDIVNERAETAERELEQHHQHSSQSERSASAVSALSGASVGSDEVFLTPPSLGDKSMTINRDWESQIKKRVDSLERLLAEERQKVQLVEKKLRLANPDNTTSGMSDDVKLHLREKELLQGELLEHQKLMHIATDQIKGLKERMYIMEEENLRVRLDYGRVCEELDKRMDYDKTPENELEQPFIAASLSASPRSKSPILDTADINRLKEQCAKFKLKAEELEYKVEELNDVWRAKSIASENEKQNLEEELRNQSTEMAIIKQTLGTLKTELCEKEIQITEQETSIAEKDSILNRREDFLHEQDDVLRQRDNDFQTLLEQVSQREETIRNLRENLRTRDERLKEKDGYIEKLNKSLEDKQKEATLLSDEVKDSLASVKEKEVIISILQEQISESSMIRDTGSETDIEKENARLKKNAKASQIELQKARDQRERTQQELEKSQKALNEAMLLWEKNRTGLQTDMNILVEKLRLYEINTTMDRKDIIMTLKDDAERYFKEKEKLAGEVHNLRKEQDADTRSLKEQVVKLQVELLEKCKHLTEEVQIGTRLQQEVDRLTVQAEMAYKLQQEEKILRAEYLAMKVRYETRLDKVSRDYSRMIITAEKLQKEKELDKEIIKGIQKNMAHLKDNYQQDLVRWEDERQRMERHSREIDLSKEMTLELKKKLLEFKEKLSEQERLKTELINKCATERSSNEIERANIQSKVNQLEEQLVMSNKVQSNVRDRQQNIGTTWEKERTEQQRLLTKAHNLALDLQQQLKERDMEFSSSRRELLNQLESDRQHLDKTNKDREKAFTELEVLGKKFVGLQQRFKDLQEKTNSDQESWLRERNELRRHVMETKLAHTRDAKRIDDILGSLIKLREIGALIYIDEQDAHSGNIDQHSKQRQKKILKYIKESVAEITSAADQLANQSDEAVDRKPQFRRSLSSSELNLLKEQISTMEGTSSTPSTTQAASSSSVQPKIQRSITHDGSSAFGTKTTTTTCLSPQPIIQQSPRLSDRPALYSSGSRSAQSSRAHTPDVIDRGFHPDVAQSSFHTPSLAIPTLDSLDTKTDTSGRARPRTLTKSSSLETPSTDPLPNTSVTSVSVTTTPTNVAPEIVKRTHKPYTRSRSDNTVLGPLASNFNRLTPRSARRKFFESQPPTAKGFGFLSYPDYQPTPYQTSHSLQRHTSEETTPSYAQPVSQMKTSASMDDRLHHQIAHPSSDLLDAVLKAQTVQEESEADLASEKTHSAKEKRKLFKKASSLDSTVGSSIAKIGMQAIPPAAPTGFTPTDIFATIRGKLRGKKSKDSPKNVSQTGPTPSNTNEKISNPPSVTQSFQEEFPQELPSSSAPSIDDIETTDLQEIDSGSPRSLMPAEVDSKRWRSKSADRSSRGIAKPVMVHADVITPIQVWQFSETAV